MTVYADSSFVVPFYALDVHSVEAQRRMATKPIIWLTPLNRCELAHALSRQVFRARISSNTAERAWDHFENDCASGVWILIDVPDTVWQCSISLARRFGPTFGVRTLDSLHVAFALELGAERFWTFDERQGKLAEAAGLDTSA